MSLSAIVKVVATPSVLGAGWLAATKAFQKRRERALLDLLERASGPMSVSSMHNELLACTLRGIPLRYSLMTMRPGGDPFSDDDFVAPKVPIGVTAKYWFRRKVMLELPSERKLKDLLRGMKERGLVEYVADDFWKIARK